MEALRSGYICLHREDSPARRRLEKLIESLDADTLTHVERDEIKNGQSIRMPNILRFGSWIGGDRDGNPFVTTETTALALRLQKREILRHYLSEIVRLGYVLTHSKRLCAIGASMADSLAQDERRFTAVFAGFPQHFAPLVSG